MFSLPKGYLSYSAMDLWQKNKEMYRQRYYVKHPVELKTPEIMFGKRIAELLEKKDPSLSHVPQYPVSEFPLEFDIEGVRILGYIDSYHPKKRRFLEFKTGREPWDTVRVRKHQQLTLYSLGIEILEGSVAPTCDLIWLETEKVTTPTMGLVTHEDAHGIRFTGKMEKFTRKIEQWERDRMRETIVTIAREISEDYEAYKNRPRKGSLGLR